MRAAVSLSLMLALSLVSTEAYAGMPQESGGARAHVRQHRLHHFRTMHPVPFLGGGFYQYDAAPYVEGAAPEPVVIPPPPPLPPRRVGDDRPTVEHTDVGVTIIRGPGSRY